MVKTRNGLTLCEARSDVDGQRWDMAQEPVSKFWDARRFGLTDTIICEEDSSVWIAGINGIWKEL